MLGVLFPAGCKPVTRGLEEDELKKRLKVLSNTLRYWTTDDFESYQIYESLAYHLAKPYFRSHPNDTIQLLVASCLSDILRAFGPRSPYSQSFHTLYEVLLFLIKQRKHLQDPSILSYDIYVYILTNLIRVDPFTLCSNIPNADATNKIFQSLFTIFSEIINKNNDEHMHQTIFRLIKNTLKSSQDVIEKFLTIIFRSFLRTPDVDHDPELSKKMLKDSEKILWPFLTKNFMKILSNPENDDLSGGTNSIISAVSSIFPHIINEILPQLKTILNSQDHMTRSKAVVILSELLSYEPTHLPSDPDYWRLFLKTFMDKDERVRITCIKKANAFLLDHSKREEVISILKLLQHDRSSSVRVEATLMILASQEHDFNPLADKDFDTRRKILQRLTNSYNKNLENDEDFEVTQSYRKSIFNEILCGYYIREEKDRLFVEKLVLAQILRFRDNVRDRMKKLYFLFAQTNDNSSRAFTELLIHRFKIRKCLSKLFESKQQLKLEILEIRITELEKLNKKRLKSLSKFFEEPNESEVSLQKFFEKIDEDLPLAESMQSFLMPEVTSKQSEDAINKILGEIGNPDVTDPYYTTVKILLERSSSIMIDEEAVKILISYIQDVVNDGKMLQFIGLDKEIAVDKGFKLLEILSFVFAPHFTHPEILTHLVEFLDMKDASIDIKVLNIFRNVGKFEDLRRISSTIWTELTTLCRIFITSGTPKQAKAAIRLISGCLGSKPEEIFKDSLKTIEKELSMNQPSENRRTSIASLGNISCFFEGLEEEINKLINIVYKKILRADPNEFVDNAENENWCEKEALPKETIYKLEAMKCLMRWLISSEPRGPSIAQILRVLTGFISKNGDVNRLGNLRPNEKSWLRLQAGSCLLKLCRFEKIGNELQPEQFYELSTLMLDDVDEVRKGFHEKLKMGLSCKCPRECLPIDFMGFYALGGLEKNGEMKKSLKRGMLMHIVKRRENTRKVMELERLGAGGVSVMKNIMPECGMIYGVVILAHWKGFSADGGDNELTEIKRGLEFFMEHWFNGDDEERLKRLRFFKQLMKRLGDCRDAQTPDDDLINSKIQTVCDVAMCFLENDVENGNPELREGDEEVFEPEIPRRYLQLGPLREPRNTLIRIHNLAGRLKGLEKKKKKQQGVIERMNLGPRINEIFGINKRTKRKTGISTMQESSTKRRRVFIQTN